VKIYSMTATFGKLVAETLTLEPGLNVIHAPNEWGKSTWSAFIVCMLYGIDTKERTTQSALADKDRYAPWSGEPMSGRMELRWNGKDITIERSTKGRVPFGEFRAYETGSGVPVPELTAANCGQMLLGVEKSVFQRAGFVRLTDMPVTQDEALRRRLNALVTTGDESGTADDLYQKLRDLRNKCRHNKTGLLPQAESQRDALLDKRNKLQELRQLSNRILERQAAAEDRIRLLQNHKLVLAYEVSRKDAHKVQQAQDICLEAEEAYARLEAHCQTLPTRETAEASIVNLEQLRIDQEALQEETLPPVPEMPETPSVFLGMTPDQALAQAQRDESAYKDLQASRSPLLLILGILALAAVVPVALFNKALALALLVIGAIVTAIPIRQSNLRKRETLKVTARYGQLPSESWVATAQDYQNAMAQYEAAEKAYREAAESLRSRKEQLQEIIDHFTGGDTIRQCEDEWRKIIAAHDQLLAAYQKCVQARRHAQALAEMAKLMPKPDVEDTLTYSDLETDRMLAHATAELRQLQLQLGQCKGQIETLGQEDALNTQLQKIQARIQKLEDTYKALTIAMETLTAATTELQRKFAPRIAQRAQAIFSHFTGGRYDRLQLTQDLGLEAATQAETGLQAARWRSDGTIDQLYLALRLAVAEELTPDAPLVLDDALVRFDDTRLSSAMEILREAAQQKQVILFTCQGRELA